MTGRPALVVLLSDGIRGHLSQSRGIAGWLSRLAGSAVAEMEVPRPAGGARVRRLKVEGRRLPIMTEPELALWLEKAGAAPLAEAARRERETMGVPPGDTLYLSAGSGAAPFTLALARLLGGKSCTVMTPSVLGTGPFNFAVVPEHDGPARRGNVLATLGAPNAIFPDELETRAAELAALFPPSSEERWGVLVGGDDGNYRLPPSWVEEALLPIFRESRDRRADLYVTTSRRTAPETEAALKRALTDGFSAPMVLLASRDPMNPVPGILGLCSTVFVSEDSVSMVSEAVTAGRDVFLLRTARTGGAKALVQRGTAALVERGVLSERLLWGPQRFDRLFDGLAERGYLMVFHGSLPKGEGRPAEPLCEARRAARWIVEGWA